MKLRNSKMSVPRISRGNQMRSIRVREISFCFSTALSLNPKLVIKSIR